MNDKQTKNRNFVYGISVAIIVLITLVSSLLNSVIMRNTSMISFQIALVGYSYSLSLYWTSS